MTENIKPSETKNNPKNTTEQSKIKLDLLPHFFFQCGIFKYYNASDYCLRTACK